MRLSARVARIERRSAPSPSPEEVFTPEDRMRISRLVETYYAQPERFADEIELVERVTGRSMWAPERGRELVAVGGR